MIYVKQLTKAFGDKQVLKGIDISVRKGELAALIGYEGSGKSTLLRCLNLLEKPTGGRISVDGQSMLARDPVWVRRRVGLVFGEGNLYPHLTVMGNLELAPGKLVRKSDAEIEKLAVDALKVMELLEVADRYPEALTKSQVQRAAIARCLCMEPAVVLLDEPTRGMEPEMAAEVLAAVRTLNRGGMTVLMATDEGEFVKDEADRVLYLDEGVIYEEGTAEEIFKEAKREKTRAFIEQMGDMVWRTENAEFDQYALEAKIRGFCERNLFARKATKGALLVVEELLQLYRQRMRGRGAYDIEVRMRCKGDGVCECWVEYGGERENLIEMADGVVTTVMGTIGKEWGYERRGERNVVHLILR